MNPRNKKAKARSPYTPAFASLTPQAQTVLRHLYKTGSITQREAIMDHSVQSLTRRIADIRSAGFKVEGEWRFHPITNQRYMRYSYKA